MRATAVRLVIVFIVVIAGATSAAERSSAQAGSPIAAALRNAPAAAAHAAFEPWLPDVVRFYAGRGDSPAWTTSAGWTAAGARVVTALGAADRDGLDPSDYLTPALTGTAGTAGSALLAEHDVLLSLAIVRYVHDLGWGVLLPSEVDKDNDYSARPFSAEAVLQQVVNAADPAAALAGYAPQGLAYGLLREALANLRAVRAAGGWAATSAGPALRAGDTGRRVEELRARLIERGDLAAADTPPTSSFDASLVAALKRFQSRHGLTPDGIYGAQVVAELNVPLSTRIQQVRLGLERLRWLPVTSSGRRIAVNLADFMAYVFEGDRVIFETRAVVGKQFHETPMFSKPMTYVVINPYWNVPPSIASAEILPKSRKDPGYLERNHMELVGGAVRQLPGPWNSLGRFKFMFPNVHNVYLHDTQARSLFAQTDRAASHGCVRIEKPAELAALLLQAQGWTPERIAATVASNQQTVVPLATAVPVYISYVTAFLGADGVMHYRRDVYGRDRKLLEALAHRSRGTWER